MTVSVHGRYSSYTNGGCRCAPCTQAAGAYRRQWRADSTGAAWRATQALGYGRLVTYTQAGESGASLRAVGWRIVGERKARKGWDVPSRPRQDRGVDHMPRTLWEAS